MSIFIHLNVLHKTPCANIDFVLYCRSKQPDNNKNESNVRFKRFADT